MHKVKTTEFWVIGKKPNAQPTPYAATNMSQIKRQNLFFPPQFGPIVFSMIGSNKLPMKDRVMLVERIRAVKKTRGPVPLAAAEQLSLAACDPYYLMDPVNILEKLPKDFYEQVEEKKWQLRGEALDKLLELVKAPKIQPGDFGDLTRVLKKFISKDTNVMLVTKVLLDKFQMMWLSKF